MQRKIDNPALKIIKGHKYKYSRAFRPKKTLFAPEFYYSSKYFFRNIYDPLESL